MTYYPIDIEKSVIKECKRRRYSNQTSKTYLYCINKFLKWTKKELGHISKKDVRLFLENQSDKGLSGNTMNTYHMAIRFLFVNVLEKRMWIDIKYNKVPEKMPIVLSKEEVKRLFESIENKRHRLMIELMYSSGMGVSELINLKVKDLEIDKGFGYVRGGKGNKDRLFVLSEKISDRVGNLIEEDELDKNSFLFRSSRDKKYHMKSVQLIIKKSCKKSGIDKKISCHSLRHSFATHLIENGYAVSQVQALLGHKSPETTMVYVHMVSPNMTNIKSPLDSLYNQNDNERIPPNR